MESDNKSSSEVRRSRFPSWLKKKLPIGQNLTQVTGLLDELNLTTVCDGAHCPNRAECYQCKTATFMILGSRCTRNCRFCAVEPVVTPLPPDPSEPERVAEATARLGLKYVVVTSVTRDDLPDGGSEHFVRTIQAIKRLVPDAKVEVLTPDFQGNLNSLYSVLEAGCDTFNHNVETIERMYSAVRPQANFRRSLDVLHAAADWIAQRGFHRFVKSGFMVGLGETDEEVVGLMESLKAAKVDVVTIGQYLAPSAEHYPIDRFVPPETFQQWEAMGLQMGFKAVFAGPFVRSSYHAGRVFDQI